MKNRSRLLTVLMFCVATAIYSLILFTLKQSFQPYSWVAYGFTLLGFAAAARAPFKLDDQSQFGAAQVTLALLYCALQLGIGGIYVMTRDDMSLVFVLAAEIALLLLYILFSAGIGASQSRARALDEEQIEKTSKLRMLQIELDSIAGIVPDAMLCREISRLAEKLSYSDPMSGPELAELEERIRRGVAQLRADAESGNLERMPERVHQLGVMMDERDARCAALK